MIISKSSFDSVNGTFIRPLMIGSSGGAGHNSGIQGLYYYLKNKYGSNIEFPQHNPTPYIFDFSITPKHPMKRQIDTGVRLMHAPVVGAAIQTIVEPFFPILPDRNTLEDEIDALRRKEQLFTKGRFYIDMLLDAFPAGYESVAIWNVLQRADKVHELRKLIASQGHADEANHDNTFKFYFYTLMMAYLKGEPYTEIISSQAMGLPALCDAVIAYNKCFENKEDPGAPKVFIHEYVIELPTPGAVYYFQGLSKLTLEQQKQMKLYAVNLTEDFVRLFAPESTNFSGLYAVPRDDNPLVRPGFTDPQWDNSEKFNVDCKITLAGNDVYDIAAGEHIASIMLGSQAGNDTVDYIESLLKSNMDKVFVFGGQNPNISSRIDQIIEQNPTYAKKIVKLGNQGDKEIAALMSRSTMLVIRAGALSTQEQLAMKHNPLQSVLIHHANSTSEKLTSGLTWEDANADALIADLRSQNVHTEKTSPDRARRHFAEAYLISFAKEMMPLESRNTWDSEFIAQHIRTIPSIRLYSLIDSLACSENKATVYGLLEKHFENCEQIAATHVNTLIRYCDKGREYIAYLIKKELGVGDDTDTSIADIFSTSEKYPALMEHDSNCWALYKSHKAINALLDTLSPTDVSASKKLRDFQSKYVSKEIKNDLLDAKDNFLQWMFRKIQVILAKVFPSIMNHFTFEQQIDKKLEDIPEETNKLRTGL